MRDAFCAALIDHARLAPYFFLTGDLGFMALEPLARSLGQRFVNAGVAEQNMVSVAAGIARAGGECWCYSIAPFCYARPFEQIRNDVCLNRLAVHLVGNGGGYAYGSMGATHHALEDYGVLLTLPGLRAYVPAFDADVAPAVRAIAARAAPTYLRLGRSELADERELPPYAPWRRLSVGEAGVLIVVGPLAGALWRATRDHALASRPTIWVVSEIESGALALPEALHEDLSRARALGLVEEHVAPGGFGTQLLHRLALEGRVLPPLVHAHARGYPSGRYGSQRWHREECGLDVAEILASLERARLGGAGLGGAGLGDARARPGPHPAEPAAARMREP
jgi:transketolase